jgi:hypothetical protein
MRSRSMVFAFVFGAACQGPDQPATPTPVAESVFPTWREHAIPQKNPRTGCIPWGYEILLRAAGTKGVDFGAFQDEFDFKERNHFRVVAEAVQKRYPSVRFGHQNFEHGKDKLVFVEARLAHRQPTLVSIALKGLNPKLNGWHIMPVVDASRDELVLLVSLGEDGKANILRLPKARFVQIHDEFEGGNDVAFLR